MGLLDGTLQQKIRRLEQLTSPSQNPKPSQKAIDDLRRNIRLSADASKGKKKTKKSKIKVA